MMTNSPPGSFPQLGAKMAAGAGWMVSAKLAERLLSLASTMILARLLVPEDFGLIALAATFLALLEIMGAFNFDLALIQNQRAERRHYDTAWTLDVVYGAFSALILVGLAVPAAQFFRDPRLEGILYVFAACTLVQGFKNVGVVAFQKELDFRREFVFMLVRKVVAVAVTLTLAYFLRSYWALALGSFVSAIVAVAISYGMHPFRPRISLDGWRDLMRFSGWVLFSNVLIFAGNKGYDFVIGRVGGAGALGLYSVAYEISNLPTTEIVWPASRVMFPGFSKLANDRGKLREAFLNSAGIVALITIPAGIGVAVLAEPIVRILLGANWLAAVPLIQVLAVFGILRALHAGIGVVYLALGKTHISAWIALPHVLIGLPAAAYLLAHYGIEAAAIGVVTAGAVALLMNLAIAKRILALRVAELLECFWRPALAATVMGVIESGLLRALGPAAGMIELTFRLLLLVAVGAVAYVASTLSLWQLAGKPRGAERLLLDRLNSVRSHRAAERTGKDWA